MDFAAPSPWPELWASKTKEKRQLQGFPTKFGEYSPFFPTSLGLVNCTETYYPRNPFTTSAVLLPHLQSVAVIIWEHWSVLAASRWDPLGDPLEDVSGEPQQLRPRRATAHRCFHRAQWASFPHRPQHSNFRDFTNKRPQIGPKSFQVGLVTILLYILKQCKTDGLDHPYVWKHPLAENGWCQFGCGFNTPDSNQAITNPENEKKSLQSHSFPWSHQALCGEPMWTRFDLTSGVGI